jgi:two-component system, sensor histidine kinase and response regulator
MEENNFESSGMKILVVDDNLTNLDVLLRTLSEGGYDISVATDGEMALKVVTVSSPDLILLDVMMPGIDGFETCARLKSNPATKNIPVIFLSAKTDTADIVKGFQSGGVDYITKPFNKDEVLVRVSTQLQLRDKTKKLQKAKNEIKQYAEELERSNENLQVFASVASHDLKAPLRKIRILADILADKYEGISAGEGKKYLARICTVTDQLNQLIDSVLEFSKLEKTPKVFSYCDLESVVRKVVRDLEVQIDETRGEIVVGDLPRVEGEPLLLYQLFQNMISNAIKYHQDGVAPVVHLASSYCGKTKRWQIEVSDNGIGIDEKYFDKIFKPFERLHGSGDFEGVGIGLATCHKIVQRLNGDITVRNNVEGGTTFSIGLPEKQVQYA